MAKSAATATAAAMSHGPTRDNALAALLGARRLGLRARRGLRSGRGAASRRLLPAARRRLLRGCLLLLALGRGLLGRRGALAGALARRRLLSAGRRDSALARAEQRDDRHRGRVADAIARLHHARVAARACAEALR